MRKMGLFFFFLQHKASIFKQIESTYLSRMTMQKSQNVTLQYEDTQSQINHTYHFTKNAKFNSSLGRLITNGDVSSVTGLIIIIYLKLRYLLFCLFSVILLCSATAVERGRFLADLNELLISLLNYWTDAVTSG